MSVIIYMGVVKCSAFTDYWRGGKLYSLPFPSRVMASKKFLRICESLRLSSSEAEAANEKKRGTAAFDRFCKIKPIYNEMRDACRRNYHPSQEISVDEQMVASKARTGIKQYLNKKPDHWEYKLFVLADSRNGYTWDFFVYEGKHQGNSSKGLGYESVMELVNTRLLGTGYKLFVDNFYTSPALFRDLLEKRIWACGTICPKVTGFPKTDVNSLDSKSPRGSMRWIRKDSLLFVQWRDTRDVSLCSTLHTARVADTVRRRVKGADGQWAVNDFPVPPAVKDYNRYMICPPTFYALRNVIICVLDMFMSWYIFLNVLFLSRFMGGVDLSDALIGNYKVQRKTQKWYKTFFYHLIDIAIVNAFLLHKDIARGKGEVPMNQKAFRETLVEELSEVGSPSTDRPVPYAKNEAHHRPMHISGHSTAGRLKCRQCHSKTPVKCSFCDVPLCFIPSRDCYNEWHAAKNL